MLSFLQIWSGKYLGVIVELRSKLMGEGGHLSASSGRDLMSFDFSGSSEEGKDCSDEDRADNGADKFKSFASPAIWVSVQHIKRALKINNQKNMTTYFCLSPFSFSSVLSGTVA